MSQNKSLKAFADVARRFCEWAENATLTASDAQRHLADLHAAILRVEIPDVSSEELPEDGLTTEDRKRVFERFDHLEPRSYQHVFDPTEDDPQIVFSVLADDFADIYQDVKEGLILYDQQLYNDAAWEWRFGFNTHWGRHLTAALTAIYAQCGTQRA